MSNFSVKLKLVKERTSKNSDCRPILFLKIQENQDQSGLPAVKRKPQTTWKWVHPVAKAFPQVWWKSFRHKKKSIMLLYYRITWLRNSDEDKLWFKQPAECALKTMYCLYWNTNAKESIIIIVKKVTIVLKYQILRTMYASVTSGSVIV